MFGMILVKLLIGFAGLWLITFVIGRKQLGQVTPLDFFTSILLGELVGSTIYDDKVKLAHLLFALAVWALLSFSIEKLSIRFTQMRRLAEGRTVLLIDRGEVNLKLLRACKLDFNQLMSMLRENGIFRLDEAEYALYEPNGKISVVPKSEGAPAIPVIEAGNILKEAFRGKAISEDGIRELAKSRGYADLHDIAYAEYVEQENKLVIVGKKRSKKRDRSAG